MLKFLLSTVVAMSMSLVSYGSFAEDECKGDADCKDGKVCILALKPPVCKDPQPAGAPCKRDAVCASKKCEVPDGKEVGSCK